MSGKKYVWKRASAVIRKGKDGKLKLPEPIPDAVENVLKTVFAGPPKKDWRYLKDRESKEKGDEETA